MMEVMAKEKSLIEEDYSCRRGENKRCCANCKTTRTPLWRAGPAGPKSLCNACGIKYRKKRRAEKKVELGEVPDKINGRLTTDDITSSPTSTDSVSAKNVDGSTGIGLSRSLKLKLMVYGGKLILKRSSSSSVVVKKQRCQRRRKLGEEEEAAFSLMALSCGSVFA